MVGDIGYQCKQYGGDTLALSEALDREMIVKMEIKLDDLTGEEIAFFLEQHIEDMKSTSPPESKHALDLQGLRSPDVTLFGLFGIKVRLAWLWGD